MLIINPGTGDTVDNGFEQAYANIKVFIEDSEVPLFVERARFKPEENGRYFFELKTPLHRDMFWEVEMPALPIEQVRYIDSDGQNIWNFPRLYVDGSSWVWLYATVKREHVVDYLEGKIEEIKVDLENLEALLNDFKSVPPQPDKG